jgi:hypothetical protein
MPLAGNDSAEVRNAIRKDVQIILQKLLTEGCRIYAAKI